MPMRTNRASQFKPPVTANSSRALRSGPGSPRRARSGAVAAAHVHQPSWAASIHQPCWGPRGVRCVGPLSRSFEPTPVDQSRSDRRAHQGRFGRSELPAHSLVDGQSCQSIGEFFGSSSGAHAQTHQNNGIPKIALPMKARRTSVVGASRKSCSTDQCLLKLGPPSSRLKALFCLVRDLGIILPGEKSHRLSGRNLQDLGS
jgi:hypothetical protein